MWFLWFTGISYDVYVSYWRDGCKYYNLCKEISFITLARSQGFERSFWVPCFVFFAILWQTNLAKMEEWERRRWGKRQPKSLRNFEAGGSCPAKGRRTRIRFKLQINHIQCSNFHTRNIGDVIAQRILLRLPSCHPRFESQTHHQCFCHL